jgi:CRP-like cAMP-binding protein
MHEAAFEDNALLRAMEPDVRKRFGAHLSPTELRRGAVLHNQSQAVDRIYFPLTGLIGILSETLAGESVQTGMVGCDGATGVVEVVGSGQHLSKAVVQIPGIALRLSAVNYRQLLNDSSAFRWAAERYVEMLLMEARHVMACNALHPVESRLGRSILDALDRSCLEEVLPLTQEALAQMLGAQRSTVAVFLSKFQRMGLIRNHRGAIEIRDKAGLERLACSCRKTLQFAREEIESPRLAM